MGVRVSTAPVAIDSSWLVMVMAVHVHVGMWRDSGGTWRQSVRVLELKRRIPRNW